MRRALALGMAAAMLAVAAALAWLQAEGLPPRVLGPYLGKRSAGHNALIEESGAVTRDLLLALDRGEGALAPLPPLLLGAQDRPAATAAPITRLVDSAAAARQALGAARAGDVIAFLPGVYRFAGPPLAARAAGSAAAPVVVRAAVPGTVTLEFDTAEGVAVSGPYWRFENLRLRGVCAAHAGCEHAFHVSGAAHHFVAVNNRLSDFNAAIKVNGVDGVFPDDGLIAANTLDNTTPRRTDSPVTPIDIVGASGWTVRGNLIADFVKAGGDRISYGAFAKGGGARTLFERNVVLCEWRLRGAAGQRVGLSFGGGGTGHRYCRDGRCLTEQDQGVMRANLIAGCSDAGIDLNNAARSLVLHNTLLDTGGIALRHPASSAEVEGNLIDGPLRVRSGALLREGDNLATPVAYLYAGYHPVRGRFADSAALDLRWRDAPPRRMLAARGEDLCGRPLPAQPRYGAFEDFAPCLAP